MYISSYLQLVFFFDWKAQLWGIYNYNNKFNNKHSLRSYFILDDRANLFGIL